MLPLSLFLKKVTLSQLHHLRLGPEQLPHQHPRQSPHLTGYAEEVEGISKDGSKYKYRQIKDGTKDIKISPFDGCGVHCEDLGWTAKEEIGLDYRPIGLQVRLPFMKRIFC